MTTFKSPRIFIVVKIVLALVAICYLWNISGSLAAQAQGDVPISSDGYVLSNDYRSPVFALGDIDADGDLDLAIGHGLGVSIHLNENGRLGRFPVSTPLLREIYAIALVDIDLDGDLDLSAGSYDQHIQFALNNHGEWDNLSWEPEDVNIECGNQCFAWGDVDGDGDPDLAINDQQSGMNKIYLNQGGQLETSAHWSSIYGGSQGLAWGDVDGDGDLDLASGETVTQIYKNNEGQLETSPSWFSSDTYSTVVLAWGDVDNDGDLDLAAGGSTNRVYLNNDGQLEDVASWTALDDSPALSLAWVDVDGDGDLDLATGGARVHLNNNGQLERSPNDVVSGNLVWGDIDGDGDLDVVAAGSPIIIYMNTTPQFKDEIPLPQEENSDPINHFSAGSFDWGDVDGDGDLDLAVAGGTTRAYLNNGSQLETNPIWTLTDGEADNLAWGDIDGDGDLDIAVVGNSNITRVYLNNDGQLETIPAWSAPDSVVHGGYLYGVDHLAWVDIDGDSDLDLYTGSQIYLNNEGQLGNVAHWSIAYSGESSSWGDVDNDGDLDLAIGRDDGPYIYSNNSGQLESIPSWSPVESFLNSNFDAAFGDIDSDGDLDLVAGNWLFPLGITSSTEPNRIYLNNNGLFERSASWISLEEDETKQIDLADVDGDGDLELTADNHIYYNDNGKLPTTATLSLGTEGQFAILAWLDFDGDGDLDFMDTDSIHLNTKSNLGNVGVAIQLNSPPVPSESSPQITSLAPKNGYGMSYIRESGLIPIRYQLFHPNSRPAKVKAYFSINGVGNWLPAISTNTSDCTTSGTVTESGQIIQLSTLPYTASDFSANTHIFCWDVLASGFYGQSDNVIFRIEADPDVLPVANAAAAPIRYGRFGTQSYPFRLRGYQPRAVSTDSEPVADSIIFHLPLGQTQGAEPIGGLERPFLTNSSGYLEGRGQIRAGDQLVALQPITGTRDYVLYHTSATPTETGLSMSTVDGSVSVQELVVSADNPLALFNLDVALEWDARKDTQYLGTLEHDIVRASEILYDLTNGQAALGSVRVFHDAKNLPSVEDPEYPEEANWQPWVDAHVRIYATNRMRPSASIGGIVSTVFTETIGSRSFVYMPGQIQMGSIWNRYGETTGSLGEDWPRTLAHELGHYLFFLDDNYLGLNDENVLIPIRECRGAMSDIYRDDFSEFHPQADWNPTCNQTLSERFFGRSDWSTISVHYPQLKIPSGTYDSLLKGPSILPLAVTQIEQYSVNDVRTDTSTFPEDRITVITGTVDVTPTLDVPILYLSENNEAVQLGKSARAFLIQNDWLVDLGRPNLGEVVAHGARPGDRICVTELTEGRLACENITLGDNQLALRSYLPTDWQPSIRVTPETTATIGINLTGVPSGLFVKARHFPKNGPAFPAGTLQESGGSYVGSFELIHASPEGHMHVWVDSDPPTQRREAVVDYSMGGRPAFPLDRNGFSAGRGGFSAGRGGFSIGRGGFSAGRGGFSAGRGGFSAGRGGFSAGRGGFSAGRGGFSAGRGGFSAGRGGFSAGRGAPAMSSDGQVVLIGDGLEFDPGEFYTLQSAAVLPDAPAWATIIGNGYWLSASDGAPDLTNSGDTVASISFQYLGAEVPQDRETYLTLYYWNEAAQEWNPLPTERDSIQNFAAASTTGPGLYALMYSVDIALTQTGWNPIGYPFNQPQPVPEVFASIEGSYDLVYWYDVSILDPFSRWKLYGAGLPDYMQTLTELEPLRGYWINILESTTLRFKDVNAASVVNASSITTSPPATFYGDVLGTDEMQPTSGMTVQAWIGDTLCGEEQTQEFNGQIVYGVMVYANGGDIAKGCGTVGSTVRFTIDGRTLPASNAMWSSDKVHEHHLPLSETNQHPLYLPIVTE